MARRTGKKPRAHDTVSISKEVMQEVEVARQTGVLRLLDLDSQDIARLRDYIAKIFSGQSMELRFKANKQETNLLELTPEEEAQKLTGEDGYFGVEKT